MKLHKNAATTPRIRREIQESPELVSVLAQRYNVHEATIRCWKNAPLWRTAPTRPIACPSGRRCLPKEEEQLILELRRKLRLSGDDILDVMRRSVNPTLSRSAVLSDTSSISCPFCKPQSRLSPLNSMTVASSN